MLRTDSDAKQRMFDPTTRLLHWLTVFSIDLATSKASHTVSLQLHRSFGVTVWAVTLVWRQFARFPNWPTDMPQPMRVAAQGSEYALYALLLAQPILGLLRTNARGDRVDLFFLGQLPALIGQDRPLARQLLVVHGTVGFLLLGLIALHVSAALFHHFWRRDDTLTAMLPSAAAHRQTGGPGGTCSPPDQAWRRYSAGVVPCLRWRLTNETDVIMREIGQTGRRSPRRSEA
jgi:cytochrome b561